MQLIIKVSDDTLDVTLVTVITLTYGFDSRACVFMGDENQWADTLYMSPQYQFMVAFRFSHDC